MDPRLNGLIGNGTIQSYGAIPTPNAGLRHRRPCARTIEEVYSVRRSLAHGAEPLGKKMNIDRQLY